MKNQEKEEVADLVDHVLQEETVEVEEALEAVPEAEARVLEEGEALIEDLVEAEETPEWLKLKLLALNVEKNAKFLSNQKQTNHYFATIATVAKKKKINSILMVSVKETLI